MSEANERSVASAGSVAAMEGKWDSDVSKRNCETMARAVEVIDDILEDR